MIETEIDEELLFMTNTTRSLEEGDSWFIDSGCTQHMTSKPELFSKLEPATGTVKIGNGDKVAITGKGIVQIHTATGIQYISDVLLVPELDQNLLSVGQMMQNGYSLLFKEGSCLVSNAEGHELFEVEMRKRCFPINWNLITEHECKISKIELDSKLWHKRYGHYNLKSIQFAQKQELVKDLPNIQVCSEVCEGCQLGKQHRLPFPSSATWRANEKLQLVHSDVCGPMKTTSLNGSKYFILFIDDFTRMTWVYFLKQKSEVFSIFKKFKALVEAQSGCFLKKLRTDNGKEYTSAEFNVFCDDLGVEHQLAVRYSPQQNGVAERKNRSVLEMARCMIFEKNLPKSFWAEAVSTAVYLQNRLPTKAVQGMTPIEAWGGIKPSIKHLRVFGSLCYTHVPDVKRSKLDEKAEKGILIGYSSQSKGYKVYNINSEKVFISRDVKVDEDAYWNWETSQVDRYSLFPILENTNEDQDEDVDDDFAVRGTRPLSEIYQRCNSVVIEPTSFEDASKIESWNQAMKEEITTIENNKTWQLVDKPKGKKVIGVKWVYRVKLNPNGSINKYKARLVVKGYIQQSRIDYIETFAPVARMDTIRVLIALAAQMRWKIWHLDVKSAFLNGNLAEEIYVAQPEGFVVEGSEDKVYKLHKALYGLKQAPRAWYGRIDNYFCNKGFKRSENDATLYVKKLLGDGSLIVSLYVDDLLVTSNNQLEVQNFMEEMKNQFEMSGLGEMNYFLGLEVSQSKDGIFLNQEKYAHEVLKKYRMGNCKSAPTPLVQNMKLSKEDGAEKIDASLYRSLIGSLLYLTASRPDLMYSASLLSRFMQSPSKTHFIAAKRVLRYLRGTMQLGIWYKPNENGSLLGYVDSDWAGNLDDMKSTTGYAFSLGSGMFSWNSKKQEIVAQSTAEAEYVAAGAAANQAIWLRKILKDLGVQQQEASEINCDSKSAIAIAENPVQHGKTKHIQVKFHAIREAIKNHEIKLIHCSSEYQVADILTKALPRARFERLRGLLGVSIKNLKEEC